MTKLYCGICKDLICKYLMDFRACGGLYVDIGKGKILQVICVCNHCAKKIALEFVEGA